MILAVTGCTSVVALAAPPDKPSREYKLRLQSARFASGQTDIVRYAETLQAHLQSLSGWAALAPTQTSPARQVQYIEPRGNCVLREQGYILRWRQEADGTGQIMLKQRSPRHSNVLASSLDVGAGWRGKHKLEEDVLAKNIVELSRSVAVPVTDRAAGQTWQSTEVASIFPQIGTLLRHPDELIVVSGKTFIETGYAWPKWTLHGVSLSAELGLWHTPEGKLAYAEVSFQGKGRSTADQDRAASLNEFFRRVQADTDSVHPQQGTKTDFVYQQSASPCQRQQAAPQPRPD